MKSICLAGILKDVNLYGEFYGADGTKRLYFTGPKEWLDDEFEEAFASRLMIETSNDASLRTVVKVMMSPVYINDAGMQYEPCWYDYHTISW